MCQTSPQARGQGDAGTRGAACRRAERLVVALRDDSPATLSTIAYLNRLSDLLFVAARFAYRRAGVDDVPWKR